MDELIDIVDKNGRIRFQTTIKEACQKGLLHKAVNIIIVNTKGEIYLQKRSRGKPAYPLHWDISASEHLKSGENFKQAAHRGLMEELSIITKLKRLRERHIQTSEFIKKGEKIIENELVELYSGIYNRKIKINKEEVEQGKFTSLNNLKSRVGSKAIKLTPWAKDELSFLLNNLKLFKIF